MIEIKKTEPYVIHINTRELYENFLTSMGDIVWDDVDILRHNDFEGDIKAIALEDVEGIRRMFREGQTPLLLGGIWMDVIEKHCHCAIDEKKESAGVEIRIYNREGLCVGVILNQQIVY